VPQIKIKEKLRSLERHRSHLSEWLGEEVAGLTDEARLIELGMTQSVSPDTALQA
jgi:hypothetical protein